MPLLNPFLFSSFIYPPHLTQLTVSKEETEGLFVIKGENYVRKKAHKVGISALFGIRWRRGEGEEVLKINLFSLF